MKIMMPYKVQATLLGASAVLCVGLYATGFIKYQRAVQDSRAKVDQVNAHAIGSDNVWTIEERLDLAEYFSVPLQGADTYDSLELLAETDYLPWETPYRFVSGSKTYPIPPAKIDQYLAEPPTNSHPQIKPARASIDAVVSRVP